MLRILVGVDWCSLPTGYISIPDDHERLQTVFFSLTRDGGAWLRFGPAHQSLDWNFIHESDQKYTAHILTDLDISMMNFYNFTDFCVLSDVNAILEINTGWHPSYFKTYNPETKIEKVLYFKQKRDCLIHTNVSLSDNKQKVRCNGGPRNSCGLKNLPEKGSETDRVFLKSATFDPNGENSWICKPDETSNSYSFTGSYYHAYIKVASCPLPIGEYILIVLMNIKYI